jgi:hypothetical protein
MGRHRREGGKEGKQDFLLHFKVQVSIDYNFFLDRLHETYDINFEDILNMFNLYQLDNYLVRLWALYHAQECTCLPNCKVGIMDPAIMNETYVEESETGSCELHCSITHL